MNSEEINSRTHEPAFLLSKKQILKGNPSMFKGKPSRLSDKISLRASIVPDSLKESSSEARRSKSPFRQDQEALRFSSLLKKGVSGEKKERKNEMLDPRILRIPEPPWKFETHHPNQFKKVAYKLERKVQTRSNSPAPNRPNGNSGEARSMDQQASEETEMSEMSDLVRTRINGYLNSPLLETRQEKEEKRSRVHQDSLNDSDSNRIRGSSHSRDFSSQRESSLKMKKELVNPSRMKPSRNGMKFPSNPRRGRGEGVYTEVAMVPLKAVLLKNHGKPSGVTKKQEATPKQSQQQGELRKPFFSRADTIFTYGSGSTSKDNHGNTREGLALSNKQSESKEREASYVAEDSKDGYAHRNEGSLVLERKERQSEQSETPKSSKEALLQKQKLFQSTKRKTQPFQFPIKTKMNREDQQEKSKNTLNTSESTQNNRSKGSQHKEEESLSDKVNTSEFSALGQMVTSVPQGISSSQSLELFTLFRFLASQ